MNVFDVLRDKINGKETFDLEQGKDYIIQGNEISKRDAIEIVNQVEQEYNNGWIPCSERLPEKNTFVLVSMKDGHMYVAKHVGKVRVGIFDCEWKTLGSYFAGDDVIAWQPLPPKYEPKGE